MAAGMVFVKIVLLCTFATLTRTQSNRTVFSPSSSSGNSHESVLDRCFQKCASLLCVISVPALACQLIDKHMHLSLSCTCGIYRNRSFRQWSFRKRLWSVFKRVEVSSQTSSSHFANVIYMSTWPGFLENRLVLIED